MSQGRKPTYSDEPLAQWIKRHVEERGWQHKYLEAKLVRASRGRLGPAGAKRLVHGAVRYTKPHPENLELLAKVLGEPPPTSESALAQMHGRLAKAEDDLAELRKEHDAFVRRATARMARLEASLASPKQRSARQSKPRSAS